MEHPETKAPRTARLALVGAALLQATVATAVAVLLLAWLREILRHPGRWDWALLLFWMLVCAPFVGWAGLTLLWTPALARGHRVEWRRSFVIWAVVAGVSALAAGVGTGLAPPALGWVAAAILILLLAGRRAVH